LFGSIVSSYFVIYEVCYVKEYSVLMSVHMKVKGKG